ncbi:DUF378 domain-containing protein [candidate division WWE3 bacterium]|nr:DUF378 domain-containing protein [candidate division WWE3 bacterium]
MKILHIVSFVLVVAGALNWGLVGLLDLNLVASLLGGVPVAEKAIYVLVGLAAVYEVATHKDNCKTCPSVQS